MSRRQTGVRGRLDADGSAAPPRGVDHGWPLSDLPLPLTSVVGREGVLAEVARLVAGFRLVTLDSSIMPSHTRT